jgi:hypothetical protein
MERELLSSQRRSTFLFIEEPSSFISAIVANLKKQVA